MAEITSIYGNKFVDEKARQDITESEEQIQQNTNDISDLNDDLTAAQVELAKKANTDGYYEDMTVGDAEQLVASQFVEDSVPYNFRITGGSADVGNREYVDGIVGGSIVWNQLVNDITDANWRAENGVTLSISNGVATFSTTIINNGIYPIKNVPTKENHVYLIGCSAKANSGVGVRLTISNAMGFSMNLTGNGAWQNLQKIVKATSNTDTKMYIIGTTADGGNINAKDVMCADLTQMFGSTIADYIYSLETATAGAGVAWFKKLFPKDYYEYNAGELLSVSGLASHDTVGFNQWDEEWEVGSYDDNTGAKITGTRFINKNPIPIFPNTTYYLKLWTGATNDVRMFYYDKDHSFISVTSWMAQGTFTTPANAFYMNFFTAGSYGTTYKNDICINLSWSGWRNGEYEAYQKHSYPLDDSLTIRGIPKLDAQNNLYYDGDEYLPDGTVNRRYAVVDLGMLTWIYFDFEGHRRFGSNLEPVNYALPTSLKANAMCDRYEVFTNSEIFNNEKIGIAIHSDGTQILVYDPIYTDIETFKAAMSGVLFVYKLATPTTETAEPYQQVQICDDFGTEEYVSTSIVPVGHNTRYPANLRDKLQHLPDLADNDGYYMIGQSNKQMHLELFRIPKAPTTDGTYTLKATVSGGTPTYTWEAQT